MLDIDLFRNAPDVVKKDLKKRGEDTGRVDEVIEADKKWRKALKKVSDLRSKRNTVTKEVAALKKSGKDASSTIKSMSSINDEIKEQQKVVDGLAAQRKQLLMRMPNILDESVPVGEGSEENVEIRKHGTPKKYDFDLKAHGELSEKLGIADFDKAAEVAGAGFYYLKGELAQLDFALMAFAINELVAKGYKLIEPPFMLNRKAYEGVTDLGDFESVMYKIEGEDLYLIATSEHPIGAMLMNEVISEDELPLKFAGISSCYRKEIGAHGVDTKGIFRVHQFNKIEQFVFCKPEDSKKYHEEIIKNSEEMWKKLEIPFRVVNICTGDIGTVAAKKYDIEAWSPRQKKYVEVVSGSNCTDYQSRRLNIKYGKRGGETQLVHTLNSTAIATSRALVAILENNQQKDGSVKIPKVLWPYMGGIKEIKAK